MIPFAAMTGVTQGLGMASLGGAAGSAGGIGSLLGSLGGASGIFGSLGNVLGMGGSDMFGGGGGTPDYSSATSNLTTGDLFVGSSKGNTEQYIILAMVAVVVLVILGGRK